MGVGYFDIVQGPVPVEVFTQDIVRTPEFRPITSQGNGKGIRGRYVMENLNHPLVGATLSHRAQQMQVLQFARRSMEARRVTEILVPVKWLWFEDSLFYASSKNEWRQQEPLVPRKDNSKEQIF